MNPLHSAVIIQLGYDPDDMSEECRQTLSDINNHGIDGGFSGFIYYSETVEFFSRNRETILACAEDLAEALGEDCFTMISNFICLKGLNLKPSDIAKICYTAEPHDDAQQVKNALAWFAAEETARSFEN